jgi:hypothetical protein
MLMNQNILSDSTIWFANVSLDSCIALFQLKNTLKVRFVNLLKPIEENSAQLNMTFQIMDSQVFVWLKTK